MLPVRTIPMRAPPVANDGSVRITLNNPMLEIPAEDIARLEEAYSLSRSVRCYTSVDCLLLLMYALRFWPVLLLMPLTLVGYWGAVRYSRSGLVAYALFIVTAGICGRLVLFYTYAHMVTRCFLLLVILLELMILRVVHKFMRAIAQLSEEDLLILKSGVVPLTSRIVYW